MSTRTKKAASKTAKKPSAKAAAAPEASGKTAESKSKLLLTLKDDVVKLSKAVQSEHAERQKISEWLAHTLKPGLAKQFAELREEVESQEQIVTACHAWIRQNKGTVLACDPEGTRAEMEKMRRELEEARREVAIEREARQQLLLWMRESFGKNLELLDARIQAQIALSAPAIAQAGAANAVAATATVKSANVQQQPQQQAGIRQSQSEAKGRTQAPAARVHGTQQAAPGRQMAAGAPRGTQSAAPGVSYPMAPKMASIVPESMSEWLRMIGYDRYIPIFKKYNMDDLAKCSRLEDRHLVKMGIDLKRHRSDVVSEIAILKQKLAQKSQEKQETEPAGGAVPAGGAIFTPQKRIVSVSYDIDSPSLQPERTPERPVQEERWEEEEEAAAPAAAVSEEAEVVRAPATPKADPFSQTAVEDRVDREAELRKQWEAEKEAWMEEERQRIKDEVREQEQKKLEEERELIREEAQQEAHRILLKERERQKEREMQREEREELKRAQEREKAKERAKEEAEADERRQREKESRSLRTSQERVKKKRLSTDRKLTPKRDGVSEESNVTVSSLMPRKRKTRRRKRDPFKSGSESESASDYYLTEGSDDDSAPATKRKDVYEEPSMHDLADTPIEANAKRSRSTSTKSAKKEATASSSGGSSRKSASASVTEKVTEKVAAKIPEAYEEEEGGGKSNAARVTDVKSDYSSLDWVVFDFDKAGKRVVFGSSGKGGLDQMNDYLDDGLVQYGLLRLVEEERSRVKFVFVVWLGPQAGVITKARSQMYKAEIMKDIGQFHLELITESRDDLQLDEVWKRLKAHVDF